jgi:hypothetical protein
MTMTELTPETWPASWSDPEVIEWLRKWLSGLALKYQETDLGAKLRRADRALETNRKRIKELEKTKGLVIPKCEWSICARHNRAYWTEEGCLSCRIEELERAGQLAISEWSTWKDVLMSNMREADWQETMDGLRAPAALRGE